MPPAIAAFFRAHNTGQTDGFNELFTNDASVADEEHGYRGTDIRKWMDGAIARCKAMAEIADLAEVGVQTIVTAQVSGSFQEILSNFFTPLL